MVKLLLKPSISLFINDEARDKEYTKPEDLESCLDILYQYIFEECIDV